MPVPMPKYDQKALGDDLRKHGFTLTAFEPILQAYRETFKKVVYPGKSGPHAITFETTPDGWTARTIVCSPGVNPTVATMTVQSHNTFSPATAVDFLSRVQDAVATYGRLNNGGGETIYGTCEAR